MKNSNKKQPNYLSQFFIWLFAFIFAVVPWALNVSLMNENIKTAEGLGNPEWLNFWGSYLGSGFGVIATMLAFMLTFRQNEKQNQVTRKMMSEQFRIQILPMIAIKLDLYRTINVLPRDIEEPTLALFMTQKPHFTKYDALFKLTEQAQEMEYYHLELSNVGLASAVDIRTTFLSAGASLGCMPQTETRNLYLAFPKSEYEKSHEINFDFADLQGKRYKQTFSLCVNKIGNDTHIAAVMSASQLIE